jgi:hypothetical protein
MPTPLYGTWTQVPVIFPEDTRCWSCKLSIKETLSPLLLWNQAGTGKLEVRCTSCSPQENPEAVANKELAALELELYRLQLRCSKN